jgi:hypothetical protein
MKKRPLTTRPTNSNETGDPIFNVIKARLERFKRQAREDDTEVGDELREEVCKRLHELLNTLWPAAARVELAVSDETCPPKFRETLKKIGRSLEEAMTIAAQASELVEPSISQRVP